MSELPLGWTSSRLAELIGVSGLFSDGDWIESKDQDPKGSIRLLQLADIGDGVFLDKSNRFINVRKFDQLRCTEVLEGDVLVARMPDPLGRACLTPKLKQRCITVVDVAIVRPGQDSVDPSWLMHFLNAPSVRHEIEIHSTGTTRRRISRSKLSHLELPIPPINEQKRIGDKLDVVLTRVKACCASLDRVPPMLKRFREAVLDSATSGKLTEDWRNKTGSQDWTPTTVGQLAVLVTKGASPKWQGINYVDDKNQTLFVTSENVGNGQLLLEQKKYVENEFNKKQKRSLLKKGDVLTNIVGASIGRAAIFDLDDIANINQAVCIIRVDGNKLINKFLMHYLNSPSGVSAILGGAVEVARANVSLATVGGLPINLPPLKEQEEICHRVESLFAFADRMDARYATARTLVEMLTPAFLSKAFRGNLVPQDPNDEPASILLERIRIARESAASTALHSKKMGKTRDKKTILTEVQMLTRKEVDAMHLTMILKERGSLTAEKLWSASQLEIDDFYDQLKDEEARGLLMEKRDALSSGQRLLEAVG